MADITNEIRATAGLPRTDMYALEIPEKGLPVVYTSGILLQSANTPFGKEPFILETTTTLGSEVYEEDYMVLTATNLLTGEKKVAVNHGYASSRLYNETPWREMSNVETIGVVPEGDFVGLEGDESIKGKKSFQDNTEFKTNVTINKKLIVGNEPDGGYTLANVETGMLSVTNKDGDKGTLIADLSGNAETSNSIVSNLYDSEEKVFDFNDNSYYKDLPDNSTSKFVIVNNDMSKNAPTDNKTIIVTNEKIGNDLIIQTVVSSASLGSKFVESYNRSIIGSNGYFNYTKWNTLTTNHDEYMSLNTNQIVKSEKRFKKNVFFDNPVNVRNTFISDDDLVLIGGRGDYANIIWKDSSNDGTTTLKEISPGVLRIEDENGQIGSIQANIIGVTTSGEGNTAVVSEQIYKAGTMTVRSPEEFIEPVTVDVFRKGDEYIINDFETSLRKTISEPKQITLRTTFEGEVPPYSTSPITVFLDNTQPVAVSALRVDNQRIKVNFCGSIRNEFGSRLTFSSVRVKRG